MHVLFKTKSGGFIGIAAQDISSLKETQQELLREDATKAKTDDMQKDEAGNAEKSTGSG